MKGIIALDIDGTTTAHHDHVPSNVVSYLNELVEDEWELVFLTGRPFCHCVSLFADLPFSCHVGPQNGALLLELPSKKIVGKRYLSTDILPELEAICAEEPTDFVLYLGAEFGDEVLYRSGRFSDSLRHLVSARAEGSREPWTAVADYNAQELQHFASVKCFGEPGSAQRISRAFEEELGLHAPVIQDPYDRRFCVIQATHGQVNKGQALLDFVALKQAEGLPTIAAGDDNNDIPLLKVANTSIAMGTAADTLKAIADIVAPPAAEEGLIKGLKNAIHDLGR